MWMMTSRSAGFIRVNDCDNFTHFRKPSSERKTLHAPFGNVMMMSVTTRTMDCPRDMRVYAQGQHNSKVLLWRGCSPKYSNPHILKANNISIRWRLTMNNRGQSVCSTIRISFHPKDKVPQRLDNGMYNCSVDFYWRFKHHLDCNLKVECEDGRDETGHCPFSSPACRGWVASRNKCYKFVSEGNLDTVAKGQQSLVMKFSKFCASLNSSVAIFSSGDVRNFFFFFFFCVPQLYLWGSPLFG